jgi:pimeloyl-ACP methyl ester carboxylesterase
LAWGVNFANLGSARTWLTTNTTTELPTWLSAKYKTGWLRQYSQPNALEAPLYHYQAVMRGVNAVDEAVLTDTNRTQRVSVLVVAAAKDQLFSPESLRATTEVWASAEFEQRIIDSGHWVSLEKGEELSEILAEFAKLG